MTSRPLGHKNYGSIPHLPGSRTGHADRTIPEGQARIATERVRDGRDRVFVTEKLDGSNVGVALLNDQLVPLTRSGYRAETSPYEQHHLFAQWVYRNADRFRAVLPEGWRLVGEWLAQAHGTVYEMGDCREPFVAFDLMRGHERACYALFRYRLEFGDFWLAPLVHAGGAISVEEVMKRLDADNHLGRYGNYGAMAPVEGAVWRVERETEPGTWQVDFLAKYVRPDKVDGKYLPEVSGRPAVWNWRPTGGRR